MSNTGRARNINEDSFAIGVYATNVGWNFENNIDNINLTENGLIVIVADGMGGANAGNVASNIAVSCIKEEVSKIDDLSKYEISTFLDTLIIKAHDAVKRHSLNNVETKGMGTTLSLALIKRSGLYLSWVGDCRTYLFSRESKFSNSISDPNIVSEFLTILTDDDSVVWNRVKNSGGLYTREMARLADDSNIITQFVGDFEISPQPNFIGPLEFEEGDSFIVCSDGVTSMLADEEIEKILFDSSNSSDKVSSLIRESNKNGGLDNITAVSVDLIKGNVKLNSSITITHDNLRNYSLRNWMYFILLCSMGLTFFYLKNDRIYSCQKTEEVEVLKNESIGRNEPSNTIQDSIELNNPKDVKRVRFSTIEPHKRKVNQIAHTARNNQAKESDLIFINSDTKTNDSSILGLNDIDLLDSVHFEDDKVSDNELSSLKKICDLDFKILTEQKTSRQNIFSEFNNKFQSAILISNIENAHFKIINKCNENELFWIIDSIAYSQKELAENFSSIFKSQGQYEVLLKSSNKSSNSQLIVIKNDCSKSMEISFLGAVMNENDHYYLIKELYAFDIKVVTDCLQNPKLEIVDNDFNLIANRNSLSWRYSFDKSGLYIINVYDGSKLVHSENFKVVE